MPLYPDKIHELAASPRFAGSIDRADADGISASFQCGSFVRYFLQIESESLTISDINFQSDGCGYAVAAAEHIAGSITGRHLADLHGLAAADTLKIIEQALGPLPPDRTQCAEIAIAALQSALARFRDKRASEFHGDTALICSCFGVGEDAIEQAIDEKHLTSVTEVSAATNAGSGCGSCRMLIQEMLDIRAIEG